MPDPADHRPGRWRRTSSWLNDHPRAVGAVYTALGVVWIAVLLLDHQPDRLVFPVLFTLSGVLWFGRSPLRTEGSTLTVPNRVWGGRQVEAEDISAIEVPTSVWSVASSWVALRNGERLLLRGADRDRARRIAEQLAVAVVPIQQD